MPIGSKPSGRNGKAAYAAYLLTHPDGRHRQEARAQTSPSCRRRWQNCGPPPSAQELQANHPSLPGRTRGEIGDAPRQPKWQSADEPFMRCGRAHCASAGLGAGY